MKISRQNTRFQVYKPSSIISSILNYLTIQIYSNVIQPKMNFTTEIGRENMKDAQTTIIKSGSGIFIENLQSTSISFSLLDNNIDKE